MRKIRIAIAQASSGAFNVCGPNDKGDYSSEMDAAICWLIEAGCTVAEVAAITGQTFQIVEQYAARVNNRQLGKAAILKLEGRRGNK